MISADIRRSRKCQRGVGLIEVMVAVLVVSIAFLGIAALLANSLSTNNSAMARSMATIASYSILDAMRADVDAAKSGSYNKTVKADSCPAPSGTTTLAQQQLYQWCNTQLSPLGVSSSTSGKIDCASSNCTITIQFDDSRAGGDTKQQVVTRAIL